MKIIKYVNRLNVNCGIIWFCDNIDNVKDKLDVIELNGYPTQIKGAKNKKQLSLILNLTNSDEELFNSIRKNVKYEINRCYKENVMCTVLTPTELINNNEELLQFEKMYNKMYKEKNLSTRLDMNLVKRYLDNNLLCLTKSYLEGKTLSYHAYLNDTKTTRLLYSCSDFRGDKEESALIARANKFLHWEDIKYFKSLGISVYDFGGIHSFDNPNGIDKFKMAFGGDRIEYYNITLGNNLKGKLFLLAVRLKRFFR